MALLAPVTFDLRDGHSVHAGRGQSVSDLVELEWLDDGHDDLHGFDPPLGPACGCRVRRPQQSVTTRSLKLPRAMPAPRNQTSCHVGSRCEKCPEINDFLTGLAAPGGGASERRT